MAALSMMLTYLMLAGVAGIVGYITYSFLTAPSMVVAKSSLDPKDVPEMRPATFMDRLSYSTKKSSTLFVQLATGGFLLVGNGIMNMADLFNAPELRDWIKLNLTPEVASGVIVLLIALNIWARLRKE